MTKKKADAPREVVTEVCGYPLRLTWDEYAALRDLLDTDLDAAEAMAAEYAGRGD